MINSLRAAGIALALISGQVFAQAGELYDADVTEKTAINDPAKAIKQAEGQWLAFSRAVI